MAGQGVPGLICPWTPLAIESRPAPKRIVARESFIVEPILARMFRGAEPGADLSVCHSRHKPEGTLMTTLWTPPVPISGACASSGKKITNSPGRTVR